MISQELFTKVATHLLTQNAKATDPSGCVYRADNGRKCAVGCLIADEYYSPELEGQSADTEIVREALSLSGVPYRAFADLRELQIIHDRAPPTTWQDELSEFAKERNFTMPEVPHA